MATSSSITESQVDDFFLHALQAYPEAADIYTALSADYNKKLYFQLTTKLLSTLTHPFFVANGTHLMELYQHFVKMVENDIKPLDLVQFCVAAAKQLPEHNASIEFLDHIATKVQKDQEASLLCQLETALLYLRASNDKKCLQWMDSVRTTMETLSELDPLIHSTLYRVALEYHKVKGTASQFFRNAMLFLGYTPLEAITPPDQIVLASDIGLAALVGEDVFNFGELLQHEILKSLNGSTFTWLHELLFAFHAGDIAKFETIYAAQHDRQPVLANNHNFLSQKIRISALMNMVFRRNPAERNIAFADIAAACKLDMNEVELLLMKAMSLKLIKGVVDQVDQVVRVKYVQPRVLDMAAIASLRDRMAAWSKHVDVISLDVESQSPDFLA